MKRIIASVLLIGVVVLSGIAQTAPRRVQPVEFEMKLGATMPIGSFYGAKPQPSVSLGLLEFRYNESGTPWDFGMMLDFSIAGWNYEHLMNDDYTWLQNNRTLAFALVSDYNFRQGYKVNPYVGIAAGVGINDHVYSTYVPSGGWSLICAPRVGVELLYHIRLATQLNFSRKGHHNAALTLGFVLGGRPKKK